MLWKRRTYLDYAAGAGGNPSSPHEEGRRARKMLEEARTDIARLVEVQGDDVIFTSGATEANALAILGHVRARRADGARNMHALYLPSAHASIVENMKLLAEEGVEIEELPLRDARVDTEALAKMLRPKTVLVAMDAVCGETGVVWNTREVAEVLWRQNKVQPCNKVKPCFARAVLHVDASQAPLTEKLPRAHFDADMLSLDASKVCGARGIGALIAHRTIPLLPLYRGGGQERGMRPGSEAPELAKEFAAALRATAQGREAFRASASRARERLVAVLQSSIQDVHINEGGKAGLPVGRQAPNILNLSLPGRDPSRRGGAEVDTDYLVALLDEAGFAVSSRSACETDSEEGSRAVFALTGDRARARATLRISWGPSASPGDLTRFARALTRAVTFIDISRNG